MIIEAKYIGTSIHSLDYGEKYKLKLSDYGIAVFNFKKSKYEILNLNYNSLKDFFIDWKIL
jgi:uncharacterized protein YlbG (UPF0298 family)